LDTATAVAALDLIISVDTSVAHLAGALAKPVWTLIQFDQDWRWFAQFGDRTPWYPTMRLFRQPKRNDWPPVIARVAEELARHRDQFKAANTAA
jgi:ADP-heptose:LPS heptosyltransferase